MLVLGSGCKYRLSLAERFDCTETIKNQLLTDSNQNPISEWKVTIKLHLVAGFIVSRCTSIVQLHLVAGFKSESDTYFSPHMARPLFYLPLPSAPLSCTLHLSQAQFC